MHLSRKNITGLCAILGGLILFSGDMLLYFNPTSTNVLENISGISEQRLKWGGITALFASWFYLLGLVHLYDALKPAPVLLRNLVILSFGAILISYGVVHAAYISIGASARIALEYNLDLLELTALSRDINQTLRMFVYPIFAICSILFIYLVWTGKSLYTRWIILFYPLIPFLLEGLFNNYLSGTVWLIVMGGYLNLILVLFFSASTIQLWNRNTAPE